MPLRQRERVHPGGVGQTPAPDRVADLGALLLPLDVLGAEKTAVVGRAETVGGHGHTAAAKSPGARRVVLGGEILTIVHRVGELEAHHLGQVVPDEPGFHLVDAQLLKCGAETVRRLHAFKMLL